MMAEETSEKVSLIIKCALQSFEDTPLQCPLDWTVQRLKQELSIVCSSKPEASRQRLIYAGHCLQDSRTLRSVFENRPDEEVRVLHLVCPPKEIPDFGLKKRRGQKTGIRNSVNANGAHNISGSPSNGNFTEGNSTSASSASNNLWTGFAQHNFYQMPIGAPPDANFQNIYNAYMYSYCYYMQQMWSSLNGNMQSPFVLPQMYAPNQYYNFPQVQNLEQQQPQVPQQAAPEVQNAAAGGMAQNAIIGDVDAPQRDFLDIVYKAIRLCFLVMLVYVYSSAERFLGVLFFILVAWFIQARRDRNGRVRDEREVAQAVNDVRQQPQAEGAENEDSGVSDEEETGRTNNEGDDFHEPSAWSIFWSTCYAFISGFFASLFPENPAPVNVN